MDSHQKLHGVPNFDILQDRVNAEKYLYYHRMLPNRNSFLSTKRLRKLEMSCLADLPRLVIDIPYMPRDMALKLEFDPVYLAKEIALPNLNKRALSTVEKSIKKALSILGDEETELTF